MRSIWNWFSHRARRADNRRIHRAVLRLTGLEERATPAVGFTATGAAAGTAPIVNVFRPDGTTLTQFPAYDLAFQGGVNLAVGEIDGNSNTVEVVTGVGAGGGPHVKVFSVDTTTSAVTTLASFMAYDPTFAGGVHVAAGRLGGRSTGEVITGAGAGGGPHVRVFDIGADGSVTQAVGPLGSFMAFDPAFAGGVNVAAGNVNGNLLDGDELVVAAGPGGGPHVRVLGATGNEIAGFMAFNPAFTGGVSPGTISPNQLVVNSLAGGGVTQFAFGPSGTITPTVITPLTTSSAATSPGLLGVNPALANAFLPGTTNTILGPNGPVAIDPVTGFPIGVQPSITTFGTSGINTFPFGNASASLAPNFNNLNLNNVTPAQVAALNGAIFPGLNLMTTNPVVAALALPPV